MTYMNLTRQALLMHYAPGVLVVLRREACPGQKTGFGGVGHGSCGCEKPNHQIFKVAGLSLLSEDEQKWCLERDWIKR